MFKISALDRVAAIALIPVTFLSFTPGNRACAQQNNEGRMDAVVSFLNLGTPPAVALRTSPGGDGTIYVVMKRDAEVFLVNRNSVDQKDRDDDQSVINQRIRNSMPSSTFRDAGTAPSGTKCQIRTYEGTIAKMIAGRRRILAWCNWKYSTFNSVAGFVPVDALAYDTTQLADEAADEAAATSEARSSWNGALNCDLFVPGGVPLFAGSQGNQASAKTERARSVRVTQASNGRYLGGPFPEAGGLQAIGESAS
jgi:hypothetical protein